MEGGGKRTRAKNATEAFFAESVDMGSYFADICLDVEEPKIEGPSPMKKKKVGAERRMVYKYPYPHASEFFANLASTRSMEEMQELLVVDMEFPDLRTV